MAQTYEALSIAAYLLAALSLLLAVFLWFRFKIWGVIGDLSGRTARKSIEEMRRINEKSGRKSYRPTPIGVSRGKVTEVMENQQIPVDSGKKDATMALEYTSNGTELLSKGTEVLRQTEKQAGKQHHPAECKILKSIVLIHTEEVS